MGNFWLIGDSVANLWFHDSPFASLGSFENRSYACACYCEEFQSSRHLLSLLVVMVPKRAQCARDATHHGEPEGLIWPQCQRVQRSTLNFWAALESK